MFRTIAACFRHSKIFAIVKRFLIETANRTNQRFGIRLAQLLTGFHVADPLLFDGLTKANDVSQRFAFSVTINGNVGTA